MYPTKSMLDYMTEINRLFPRNVENGRNTPIKIKVREEIYLPSTPVDQMFNHSLAHSSSSTDTSPDSLSDIFGYRFPRDRLNPIRPDQSPTRPDLVTQQLDFLNPLDSFLPQIFETPSVRRQQPVMGKRLSERLNEPNIWFDEQLTPPRGTTMTLNQMYYELFPAEAKSMQREFKMSYTSLEHSGSRATNISSYASSMSLWTETMSELSEFSPTASNYPGSPGSSFSTPSVLSSGYSFQEPFPDGPSSSTDFPGSSKMCSFCRRNGETSMVYMTHKVKEKIGNRNVVTCPILRSHVCVSCGATGDNAHTISYCPILRSNNQGRPLPSTTVTLKKTRVKSNGMRRF